MKCDFCGYDGYESGKDYGGYGNAPHNVKLYKHYKMNLCDRCVDKINSVRNGMDIDEYWEDCDAIEAGFKPFPKNKEMPKYHIQCFNEIERINRKLKELYDIEKEYYLESNTDYSMYKGKSAIDTIRRAIEEIEKKYAERI